MIKTFKERLKVSVKWFLPLFLFTFLPLLSCSESEDEVTNEYANWQTRNEAYIADIAKKCQRVKVFTKDQQRGADRAADFSNKVIGDNEVTLSAGEGLIVYASKAERHKRKRRSL